MAPHSSTLAWKIPWTEEPGRLQGSLRVGYIWASQVVLVVRNSAANARDMREVDLVPGSGRPLEEGMATHSNILLWRIPWTEEPGGLQSMESLESDTTERLQFHFSLSYIGEGNGNPLQCSCLENPRDGEAWWAAVYGVAQSRTRLKRLSSSRQN